MSCHVPHYVAPEQIQGNAQPASDQYTLGAVVYEWLCEVYPFKGASYIEIAMQHLTVPPPSLYNIVPKNSINSSYHVALHRRREMITSEAVATRGGRSTSSVAEGTRRKMTINSPFLSQLSEIHS
jgi:serine/threonine protein kinase